MTTKRVYKKRDTKEKPSISKENKEELITPVEEVKDKTEEVKTTSIPLVPIDSEAFSIYKGIIGINRNFLNKKYDNKKYTLKIWEEILIKEKIN